MAFGPNFTMLGLGPQGWCSGPQGPGEGRLGVGMR